MTIRVLLADDHVVVRDGLRYILEATRDIQVVGAVGDGLGAVTEVKSLEPDVVVMDISMPGLDGIEATRQIRTTGLATQIVILSVHSTFEHISRALQAGALAYLLKESAGSEVVTAVRAVHAGRRYLSQSIADTVIDDYIHRTPSLQAPNPMERLSPREVEVLQLMAEAKTNAEIAATLSLSIKTIETYRSRLMHKLGISDFYGLIKFAIQHRLIPPT